MTMKSQSVSIVIADSSRLGTYMLEKILVPYANVVLCHESDGLHAAISKAPQLCLISHQWPKLETLLDDMRIHRPEIHVLLLASPESNPSRLAGLCDEYQAGVLYRPYEPPQVMREILSALSSSRSETDEREVAPPMTPELAGPDLVLRDLAFCRRHHLSYSLVALRIEGYALLSCELGEKVFRDLDWLLLEALSQKLRREDSICFTKPGIILLSLPGTPAVGARVLALRLRRWLGDEGVEVHSYQVAVNLAVGIHCMAPHKSEKAGHEEPQSLMDMALWAADQANGKKDDDCAVQLTASARAACSEDLVKQSNEETEIAAVDNPQQNAMQDDAEHLWDSLEAILREDQSSNDDANARETVLKKMARMLACLGENERMQLVDELLMASTHDAAN